MAYATLAELKRYLGTDSNDDDGLLSQLLASAQAFVGMRTGRTFEASADTERTFDAVRDVDGAHLWLDEDLCAVTSVTNGDGTTVTAGQYVTDPRNETPYFRLKLLSSSGVAWTYTTDPEDAISITGRWAYSESAPDDIKQATIRLAAHMYRQKDSSTFETTAYPDAGIIETPTGIPKDVQVIISHYRKRTI